MIVAWDPEVQGWVRIAEFIVQLDYDLLELYLPEAANSAYILAYPAHTYTLCSLDIRENLPMPRPSLHSVC